MVLVEFKDASLRESFALFLDASFAGSVFDRETGLELDLRLPQAAPDAELRAVERLLRTWHVHQREVWEADVTLTASPSGTFSAAGPQPTLQRRLRL